MILSLELKNFRRHEALTVNFTQGLNAIRGANEGGKSSVIESALYALYGAKALRDTLAETVTWGCKESSLKVGLVIRVRDTLYSFTRSKAGAECKGDDGTLVTGQAEVSSLAADLLGADAKVASLLMLASQSGLRGALDDGPAAVSGLMAKLADFDIIDKIVEAATQKLSLGSVLPLQAKVTESEEELSKLRESKPSLENANALQKSLDGLDGIVEALEKAEAEELQIAVADTSVAVDKAEDGNRDHAVAVGRVGDIANRIVVEDGKRKGALADITKAPGPAVLAGLREDARLEGEHAAELRKYRTFQGLKCPVEFWEGDEESFAKQLKVDQDDLAADISEASSLEGQIKALKASRITSGKCPTCGAAAVSDEHVAEHNTAIDTKLSPLESALGLAKTKRVHKQALVTAMEAVQRAAGTFQRSWAGIGERVLLDTNFFPAKASWGGAVPADQPSTVAATKLREAEALQRTADMAQGRYDAAVAGLTALDAETVAAKLRVESLPKIDLEPLKKAYDDAYAKYSVNAASLRSHRDQMALIVQELNTEKLVAQQWASSVKLHEDRITETNVTIKQTEFNNGLMLKLKKVKPAITDYLWNMTLSAVGTFFSQMRGEASVVSKDKDGFKVNGKSIESLSGSTLDVLALATRVALTRTFIPHSSFLVLDEPAHGCDNDRTGNVLGFLAGAGFPQTILASHDDMSEAVADNVISL